MTLGTILLIVLVLLLLGVIPTWPSRGWGYTRQRRARAGTGNPGHSVAAGQVITRSRCSLSDARKIQVN